VSFTFIVIIIIIIVVVVVVGVVIRLIASAADRKLRKRKTYYVYVETAPNGYFRTRCASLCYTQVYIYIVVYIENGIFMFSIYMCVCVTQRLTKRYVLTL